MLLPVEWDKNYLLITKRLQMMPKVIGYSCARTIIKSAKIHSKHQVREIAGAK